jgi:hypothetical protein
METIITYVDDFVITGKGKASVWQHTDWLILHTIGSGNLPYTTKAKVLWSRSGIYFLFDCEDRLISCGEKKNFEELYLEDVLEVFLWPDEEQNIYFEYELSPLGFELPLLVPNNCGLFHGWLPFRYINERKILYLTVVEGGKKESNSPITGWKAEFIIPFDLLLGMTNCPPKNGTKWRANMCRLDYDSTPRTQWSWSKENMADNFHNYKSFGTFVFIR